LFEINIFVVLTAINAEKTEKISGKERGVGPSILLAYICMIEIFAIPNIRVANIDFIFLSQITLHITGSKMQSDEERGAALFAVRVLVIVSPFPISLSCEKACSVHQYRSTRLLWLF
jgi:hypothetical protein